MNPAANRWLSTRFLVTGAIAYMLLHALLIYGTLPNTLRGSYPFLIVTPLLAAAVCLLQSRRAPANLQLPWLLISFGLLIWGEAMVFSAVEYFAARSVETIAGVADLLFLLYVAPLLLVLSSPVKGARNPLFMWMDTLQLLCAGCLVYSMVFSRLPFQHEAPHPISMPAMLALYNGVNFTVALGASLRSSLHPKATDEGRMFRIVAWFLWAYAVCAAVNNYMVAMLADQTKFIDLDGDPAFLLITVMVLRLRVTEADVRRTTQPDNVKILYVDNASPVIYTVALVALGAASLQQHFVLGLTGIALALAVYAIRATALQNRFIRSERLLQEANGRLRELSLKDALTGVANRRSFDQFAAKAWPQAATTPLALLLIDLDHFKGLNDVYGHRAGDACLATVAAALQSAMPEGRGLLARYGGEEFAVVMTGMQPRELVDLAETMREAVWALGIENPAAALGVVSVSIGATVAWQPAAWVTLAEFVETADQALYRAKLSGRDRVEFLALAGDAMAAEPLNEEPHLRR